MVISPFVGSLRGTVPLAVRFPSLGDKAVRSTDDVSCVSRSWMDDRMAPSRDCVASMACSSERIVSMSCSSSACCPAMFSVLIWFRALVSCSPYVASAEISSRTVSVSERLSKLPSHAGADGCEPERSCAREDVSLMRASICAVSRVELESSCFCSSSSMSAATGERGACLRVMGMGGKIRHQCSGEKGLPREHPNLLKMCMACICFQIAEIWVLSG